jgi:ABC-type uncharacterized transport system substrate-binding protein
MKVDVIFANGTPGALAARKATRDIPIIFANVSDPVASGLVTALSRPGGNATGLSNNMPELGGKMLQLVRDVKPRASKIAVLKNPRNPGKLLEFSQLEASARPLGISVHPCDATTVSELDQAFTTITKNCQNAPPLAVGMNGKLSIKLPAFSEAVKPHPLGWGRSHGATLFYFSNLTFFVRLRR